MDRLSKVHSSDCTPHLISGDHVQPGFLPRSEALNVQDPVRGVPFVQVGKVEKLLGGVRTLRGFKPY